MDPVLHVLSVVHVHAYSRQINKETTVCIFFIFLVLLFFHRLFIFYLQIVNNRATLSFRISSSTPYWATNFTLLNSATLTVHFQYWMLWSSPASVLPPPKLYSCSWRWKSRQICLFEGDEIRIPLFYTHSGTHTYMTKLRKMRLISIT